MKKQQKAETPQNTTKTSPFLDKNMISEYKNMKNKANLKPISNTIKPSFQTGNSAKSKTLLLRNKANFNNLKFTASPCTTVVYNDLQTKTKNGANPNKPNLKPISEMENPRLPKNKKMENEANLKPIFSEELFSGNPCFFKTLFLGYKANFKNLSTTLTRETKGIYNDLHPKTNNKSKPNPNPMQSQSKPN